jgi:hypothetical protein
MGVLVDGTGDGEATGISVAIGNSVAGAQAVRIAMQIKTVRNFFIRLFCHKYLKCELSQTGFCLSYASTTLRMKLFALSVVEGQFQN